MEFEWILQKEVLLVLKQLHDILVECAHRFPVPLYGNEGKKVDKFVLTSAPEQLKVVVTLTGDAITHAVSSSSYKTSKSIPFFTHRTLISKYNVNKM
jgi:protein rogdi